MRVYVCAIEEERGREGEGGGQGEYTREWPCVILNAYVFGG